MGHLTKIFATLAAAYLCAFTFKLVTLLVPTLFLNLQPGDPTTQGELIPSWAKGSRIRISKVQLVNEPKKKIVNITPIDSKALLFTDDATPTRFQLDLNQIQEMVVPNTVVRLVFSTSTSSIDLKVQVPLVIYRPAKSLTNRAVKYNLVEGWPILGSLYPRNISAVSHVVHQPAYKLEIGNKAAFLVPRITVQFVSDWTIWPLNTPQSIPDHIRPHLRIDYSDEMHGKRNRYLPIISTVQMGVKQHELIQINKTALEHYPSIEVEVSTMGISRWAFYAVMEDSFKIHRQLGIVEEADMDDIRSLLTENSAEVLSLTMVISLFHLLFDTLAFQSEISYWRKVEKAEGLSMQAMILGVVCQTIVTLYLQEEDASMLVLVPCYLGIVIGLWKLVKLVSLKKHFNTTIEPASVNGEDSTALRYMSVILVPMVLAYSFLALVRDDHASWYSWLISSLATSVYAGGFALMTPQIFLNYKLKSVAHLDWAALWYRAFNTFIDDFFAFLIPMPGLARMAVLRDDLIFLIFLYQRWIYPARVAATSIEGEKQKEE